MENPNTSQFQPTLASQTANSKRREENREQMRMIPVADAVNSVSETSLWTLDRF